MRWLAVSFLIAATPVLASGPPTGAISQVEGPDLKQQRVLAEYIKGLGGSVVVKQRGFYTPIVGVFLPGPVTDAQLRPLRRLTTVEDLCLFLSHITNQGLKTVAKLTALRTLYLSACYGIDDEGLRHLPTTLSTLRLAVTPVTDNGLQHLKRMTRLQSLTLNSTNITDAGLAHVAHLTILQELALSDTKITDAGLRTLKGMRKMRRLDLSGTRVTDEGMKFLSAMTDLETLDIRQTQVTDKGVANLKRALPNVTVIR
jgi:hypothetical protein